MRKLKLSNVAAITRFALAKGWISGPLENFPKADPAWGMDPMLYSQEKKQSKLNGSESLTIETIDESLTGLATKYTKFAGTVC